MSKTHEKILRCQSKHQNEIKVSRSAFAQKNHVRFEHDQLRLVIV